ncbi:MAG TPA: hypothetical protein VKT73_04595 [Xanthobacteraceae bacterium]|nr:hypothetical protein [Xanthobacteraceae bacterium]
MGEKKRPTVCIFCGGTPLTEEHVYGKWLRREIPKNEVNHRRLNAIEHTDRSDFKVKLQGGDGRVLKIKCACKVCNTGWMRDFQNEAMQVVKPMALGKPILLDGRKQLIIANWATMVTMTSEFIDPATVSISQDERTFFHKNKFPPDNFRIWIGRLPMGLWRPTRVHIPMAIKEQDKPNDDAMENLNTQASTHVIGELFIHVLSSPFKNIVRDWSMPMPASSALVEIWPLPSRLSIVWPQHVSMTGQMADTAAGAFYQYSKGVENRFRKRLGYAYDASAV